ncbi:hypothetical protein K466DRAFT_581027 [Polyporus arcularius HHB13444]|uniref:DUF6533 domain-containing protein n=1 Tax=Polyporus arcularius HHB13444 TaxID=1314778 RepID=A0A5C3PZE3_9APHY|nr:hypothetical protein K466DRAFT_581027 [Polyporus arcularius HHB13444]
MANAIEQAILLELLPTITKIRYAELASTVIILLDHVLTLDQEPARWSLGKGLFLLNRYYALVICGTVLFNHNTLTDEVSSYCLHWFRWQGCTGVITFIVAELFLQLRLYALYFRDKRILACISLVCLGAALGSAYVMGHALSLIVAYAVKLPEGTTVCVPLGLPDNFYAFWIPMLISESVLCGFALFRGFKSHRPADNVLKTGRRIIEVLVRDSASYFVVIFATYLTNAIIFLTRPDAEVEIPIGFAVALSCVLSNRLCLNVRGYIRDGSETLSVPHPEVYSHGRSRSLFATFRIPEDDSGDRDLDLGSRNESDDRIEAGDGNGGGVTVGRSTSKVVRAGTALGEVEMRELRVMRAESPRHLRMFSITKRSDEAIEMR